MAVLATDTARGPLMLRPSLRLMPGWDMVASMATVSVWAMAATAMAVLATDTARGPLMLRPSLRLMPGWDMVASTATVLVWAMAVTAMAVLAMDTARGLLMLRPSPGWDMVDSTVTAVLATDTARSKLYQKPRLTISYNTPNDLNRLIQTSLTRDHVELLSYIPKSFKIM